MTIVKCPDTGNVFPVQIAEQAPEIHVISVQGMNVHDVRPDLSEQGYQAAGRPVIPGTVEARYAAEQRRKIHFISAVHAKQILLLRGRSAPVSDIGFFALRKKLFMYTGHNSRRAALIIVTVYL